MSQYKSLPFSMPMSLRWSDMDELGHVNNAKYLSYLEEARIHFFTKKCNWNWRKDGLILANVNIDYMLPLFYTDNTLVEVGVEHIGTKSFKLSYQIVVNNDGNNIVKAKATTVMVTFDYETKQSVAISQEVKHQLEAQIIQNTIA